MKKEELEWREFVYQLDEIQRQNPDWKISQIIHASNVNKITPGMSNKEVIKMIRSYIVMFNLHNISELE